MAPRANPNAAGAALAQPAVTNSLRCDVIDDWSREDTCQSCAHVIGGQHSHVSKREVHGARRNGAGARVESGLIHSVRRSPQRDDARERLVAAHPDAPAGARHADVARARDGAQERREERADDRERPRRPSGLVVA